MPTEAHRVEHLNDNRLIYLALDPDGVWSRSEFPHPLVTVDYDADDNVIGISAAGPRIPATLELHKQWVSRGSFDPRELVSDIEGSGLAFA